MSNINKIQEKAVIAYANNNMSIQVSDKEIRVKWLGETRICALEDLAKAFKSLDDREKRRQIINLWNSGIFKVLPTGQENKYKVQYYQSPEWDEQMQADLESIQGSDPYLPLY